MKKILISEVASDLGISTSTIRRWEREGRLSFKPERDAVGRRVFAPKQVSELERVLNSLHACATGKDDAR